MSQYELLNDILKKGGKAPVSESATSGNAPKKTQKLSESDVLCKEVDMLVEESMKESLKGILRESNVEGAESLVENTKFTPSQVSTFIAENLDPIFEITGNLHSGKVVNSKTNNVKGANLAVYEVALTLLSAEAGALTMESLDNIPVKSAIEPNAQELEDIITATEKDSTEPEMYDFGDNEKESDFKRPGGAPTVDKTEYLFDVKENSGAELMNNGDGFKKHKLSRIPADGGGPNPDAATIAARGDYDFPDSEDDIEDTLEDPKDQGKTANEKGEMFDNVNMESRTILSKIKARILGEMVEDENGKDPEDTDDSVESLTGSQNEEAGTPGPGEDAAGEFEGDGTADEKIVEQQSVIAKYLIGNIFAEYGITQVEVKSAIVKEAINYALKYGYNNLYPNFSDVAMLVSTQNKLAEAAEMPQFFAANVVKESAPVLSESHRKQIIDKSFDYIIALEMAASEGQDEYVAMLEAVSFATRASAIERHRQAFRHRMSQFCEGAKTTVTECWVVKPVELTEAAQEISKDITIKTFIKEGDSLSDYLEALGEHNPLAESCIKRASTAATNDVLTTAAIFAEMGTTWIGMKNRYYSGQPLVSKKAVLENMIQTAYTYRGLCSAMKDSRKPKVMIENFIYRIQGLKDKVDFAISQTSKSK